MSSGELTVIVDAKVETVKKTKIITNRRALANLTFVYSFRKIVIILAVLELVIGIDPR